MLAIAFGVLLFVVLLALLALFARPGPSEARTGVAHVANLRLTDLVALVRDAFASRGYTVLGEAVTRAHADLLLQDASPLTGQTVYVRCALPDERGNVSSIEVQAALDRVRGEHLGKAVVVTSGAFTDEAVLAAQDANVELYDGDALVHLLGAPPGSSPEALKT